MITGRFTSRNLRFLQGLVVCLLVLILLAIFGFKGDLNRVEYRGLDWLQRHFTGPTPANRDIVIIYIDQKSIDFFQRARGIGWPWPRDSYALVVEYLKTAGARAIVFDAIYSEPSVFGNDFDDDTTFSRAMTESGRVIQTLILHKKIKGGAPTDPDRLNDLFKRRLNFDLRSGPRPPDYSDVTMPITELEKPAWGLGVINIRPEADGVVRRLQPVELLKDAPFPTLSLGVFLKINNIDHIIQTDQGLEVADLTIPQDKDGKILIKYYGGMGTYRDYTIAAVIQSAMNLKTGESPLVSPDEFNNKIVFIGAKAASLYDLRSTPVADSLPGVEIHASLLSNLLGGDFLRESSLSISLVLAAALLLGTLSASVFTGSVFTGAGISVGLSLMYVGLSIFSYQNNLWIKFIFPLAGQVLVFITATLLNYYGEGREKRAVRNAFSRYLSPDVVASVLDNPELLTLGGDRRVMTCFFSDLAGFTSISEALSPEDLVHLLNRYLSLMTEAIMARGGTVDKFEGDAIMAFWGAPLIQEDHALRACLSAIDQQEIIARFREETQAEGLPELRVRMGLNTGPMIVGNMGSEERFDYTVMGDSVNLASRLEGANKEYCTYIMISESTYEMVKDDVEVRELDLLRVKGKNEPIKVFELLGRKNDLPEKMQKTREIYNQGLSLYRAMDFTAAEERFKNVLDINPEDGPSLTYIDRCRAYSEDPPPDDWDRVFTMTSK